MEVPLSTVGPPSGQLQHALDRRRSIGGGAG
jgi:hypothetical protein